MGEVYRATDSRLARDVALKVLPEPFARDADRMIRFAREAKLLASLNHPNIAAIYGLEEANGVRALVMELVEPAGISTAPDPPRASAKCVGTLARRILPRSGSPFRYSRRGEERNKRLRLLRRKE